MNLDLASFCLGMSVGAILCGFLIFLNAARHQIPEPSEKQKTVSGG